MSDFPARDLLAALSRADFTGASTQNGGLTITFGPWTIATRDAGWRVLDAATLVTGSADPNAAATLAGHTLGRVTALHPISKFDIAFRLGDRWLLEFYALSPAATDICTLTGPGLHAAYTAADGLVIARAN
jgi:hypothetical protein